VNVGSLFSGIGGIDLGLEQAGHRVVFQAESDEWRRRVLASRFPGITAYADVRRVGRGLHDTVASSAPENLRREDTSSDAAGRQDGGARFQRAERVDLLTGGFPCQDLSVAGRRAGLIAGERSSLFFEFARIADELVPAGGYVLVENVPGLLSSNDGRDFAVVLATLADIGFYDFAWRVLDSRHFGVPQRRRRVFILARRHPRGDGCAQILLESEGGVGHFAPIGETRAGTTYTSSLGTTRGGGHGLSAEKAAGGRLIPVSFSENQRGEVLETPYSRQLTSGGGKPGQGYGAVRVNAAVRRLTPVECERLQGFPDNWTRLDDTTPDSRRYAALGDAVTVNVARWIGRRLAAFEERAVAA
jgi:DNA (cytosine-5)-methyltransferase 1